MSPKQRFIIALIMVSTISIILLLMCFNVIVNKMELSDKARELIVGIIIAKIAIISMIIGMSNNKDNNG